MEVINQPNKEDCPREGKETFDLAQPLTHDELHNIAICAIMQLYPKKGAVRRSINFNSAKNEEIKKWLMDNYDLFICTA